MNVEDSLWSFDEDEKTGERVFVWTLVKLNATEGRKHWKCVANGEPEIDTHRFCLPHFMHFSFQSIMRLC